jgi:hypothetical protein
MTNNQSPPSLLARLRALTPMRGLDLPTAIGIADRQAAVLLRTAGITSGPVPIDVLQQVPSVRLGVTDDLPTSGISYWTGREWRLDARTGEAKVRQRFTLAHEFKHVIDHPGRDLLYADHHAREQVADHFAAALLMPKNLLWQAWCSGTQDIAQLAELFTVSTEAMTRRLLFLGMIDQRPPRPVFCTRGRSLHPQRAFAIAGYRTYGGTP